MIQLIPGYDPVATAGDCYFDVEAAQLAIDFIEQCLRHVKGEWAGTPLLLGTWEKAIVANLFGWKRPDGRRRYREALIYVPRKNGKTTLTAAILLYVLFCDGEPGAEIYSAAADREQARLVFQQAIGMVRQEPELRQRATIFQKSITLKDNSGSYVPLSADVKTKFGFNTHFVIVDELHTQSTRDLVDALITSTGARRQPLVVAITTADYDHPSICNEKRDYALKVKDGIIQDQSFLPVIFEAPRDADWHDEKLWATVNPNLGVSIDLDYLRREHQRACESPAYENTFKRLHLNMMTEQATRWLTLESWDACGDAVLPTAVYGAECYAGLDLASTTDIAAFVLYFPDHEGAVLPFFWAPRDNAERRERRDRVPYLTWAREGYLELTEGNVIDYDVIETRILALAETYRIREIAFDRWNSTQLVTHLMEKGLNMIGFGQGFQSMAYPTKEVEKLVLSQGLRHGGHPVLRWMASNVAVQHKRDAADNIKPDKAKSSDRIDGIVALIMAVGRAMTRQGDGQSVYETEGVLWV